MSQAILVFFFFGPALLPQPQLIIWCMVTDIKSRQHTLEYFFALLPTNDLKVHNFQKVDLKLVYKKWWYQVIPCQDPPELVNWNFLILKQFFTKHFLRPWNSYFQKKMFDDFYKFCTFFVFTKELKYFLFQTWHC